MHAIARKMSQNTRDDKGQTMTPSITLLHSPDYTTALHNGMQHIHNDRDILLSSLLFSCGLLGKNATSKYAACLRVIPPRLALKRHMSSFHKNEYLDLLECYPHLADKQQTQQVLDAYGLIDDCSLPETHSGRCALWTYCQYVAGASLYAAQLLTSQQSQDVVINWGGGRHHAFPSHASGFCYVNDTVLAIQQMVRLHPRSTVAAATSPRILYVDIDIHHADAVQHAFYDTNQVLTVSFHRYAPGFFPSQSGASSEKGRGVGLGYNVNVPLPAGLTDEDFIDVFKFALTTLVDAYDPQYLVLAVGADGLMNDPLVSSSGGGTGWNLTSHGLAACVEATARVTAGVDLSATAMSHPTQHQRRLLVLGGGGYNEVQTARTFAICTAAACCGVHPALVSTLPETIPTHDPNVLRYSPDFLLHTSAAPTRANRCKAGQEYQDSIRKGKQSITLASDFIRSRNKAHYRTLDEIRRLEGDDAVWY